jgi:hypothetical protein
MVPTMKQNQQLRTLLEKLDAVRESTVDEHTDALYQARLAFEARLAQAVAYKLTQALDAITGD